MMCQYALRQKGCGVKCRLLLGGRSEHCLGRPYGKYQACPVHEWEKERTATVVVRTLPYYSPKREQAVAYSRAQAILAAGVPVTMAWSEGPGDKMDVTVVGTRWRFWNEAEARAQMDRLAAAHIPFSTERR